MINLPFSLKFIAEDERIDFIKGFIVTEAVTKQIEIAKMFDPELTQAELLPMFGIINWELTSQEKAILRENEYKYVFNCEPFDDQLRACVYLTPDKETVLRIHIQGE